MEVQDDEVRVEVRLEQETRNRLMFVDFSIEHVFVTADAVLNRAEGCSFDHWCFRQADVDFIYD